MTRSERASNGAGDVTRPIEVLYLDQARLFSYSSQLFDGITRLRRILDASAHGEIEQPKSKSEQETKTQTSAGTVGLNAGVQAKGEVTKVSSKTTGIASAGRTDLGLLSSSFTEEKVEYHNLLLLVEKELSERGLLQEFSFAGSPSGLQRIEGTLSFLDWEIMRAIMNNWSSLKDIVDDPSTIKFSASKVKAVSRLLSAFSFSDLTAIMETQDIRIAAPLDPGYLSMTIEQARSIYLSGSFRATVIGYFPPKDDKRLSAQTDSAWNLAPGISDLMSKLLDEPDIYVLPLAIYMDL